MTNDTFDIRAEQTKPTSSERDFENALRPLQFDDFSGQRQLFSYCPRIINFYKIISSRETIRARLFSSISTVKIMANTKKAGIPP